MIELRGVMPADSDLIHGWRNLPEVSKFMYTDHDISREEHQKWFNAAMVDPMRKYWVIRAAGSDLGLANLYDIDAKNRRCGWAFYLASSVARGRGLGGFVEYQVIEYVFNTLGFYKLWCEVLASNQGVRKLHLGFGFVQEGVFRAHIAKGGEFQDVYYFGLLRADWVAKRPELERKLGRIESRSGGGV